MSGPKRPKVVAFDIIETTFRIEPLDRELVGLGLPPGLVMRLYAEALRDSVALAAANRFQPFLDCMAGNVAVLLSEHGLSARSSRIREALEVMRELPPHRDALSCFRSLRNAGVRIFALSNGAARTTRSLLEKAGMQDLVEEVLATADVKLSKPRPEVYLYAVETAKVRSDEMMLVACHPWDVGGAKAAGLLGGFVARGRPYSSVFEPPDLEAESLDDMAAGILALPKER